jgi:hypothetical protein
VVRLLRAVPHSNVPGTHPQHFRERHPRIGPVPHHRQLVAPGLPAPKTRKRDAREVLQKRPFSWSPSTLRYPYSRPSKNGSKLLAKLGT